MWHAAPPCWKARPPSRPAPDKPQKGREGFGPPFFQMNSNVFFIPLLIEIALFCALVLFDLGVFSRVFLALGSGSAGFLKEKYHGADRQWSPFYEYFLLALMGVASLAGFHLLARTLPFQLRLIPYLMAALFFILGGSVNPADIRILRCPVIRIGGFNLNISAPTGPKAYIIEFNQDSRFALPYAIILNGIKLFFWLTLAGLLLHAYRSANR